MKKERFIAEHGKKLPCSFEENPVVLYSIDFGTKLQKYTSLITRPGSDFKNLVAWLYFQLFGLKGYRKWLRNRLSFADGKSFVLVRVFQQRVLKKNVSGNPANSR